jgi:hypothetical protein
MYADNTQLYVLHPDHIDLTVIQQCTNDIHRWYAENGMLPNPTKSAAIAVGTRALVAAASASGAVIVAGNHAAFSGSVKLLGVTIDSILSFDQYIINVIRNCNQLSPASVALHSATENYRCG